MKFDVIIGNPPYQSATGVNGGGHTPLYILFVKKSQELLNIKGFLAMITPPTAFKIGMGGYLNPKEIIYINNDAGEYFTVTSSIWYFIQQLNRIGKTVITKNKKSFVIEIEKDTILTIHNEMEHSILTKIQSYRGGVSFKTVGRDVKPLPIGAVFFRRLNRYTTFDAKLTYDGMEMDMKLNQDYTLVHPDAAKIVDMLNSDIYTFLLRRYQTSPFITLEWIRSLNVPINDAEHEFGLTHREIAYLKTLDYSREVFTTPP